MSNFFYFVPQPVLKGHPNLTYWSPHKNSSHLIVAVIYKSLPFLGPHHQCCCCFAGSLRTLSLRPTVLYGEGDERFVPTLLKVGHKFNGIIPKLCGVGGKQQISYVGNAAWAHICAKNALNEEGGRKIGGLPMFITDDTGVVDTVRFCQRLSSVSPSGPAVSKRAQINLRPSWWSVPFFVTYLIAMLLEFVLRLLCPLLKFRIPFPPRGLVSYQSSIFLYSRLRAALHIDYDPRYTEKQALLDSAAWYEQWNEAYVKQLDKERMNKTDEK